MMSSGLMFLLWLLGTIGLTAMLVDGKIFQPLRNKTTLWGMLTCYQCCGFWSGLLCQFLTNYTFGIVLLLGFAGSYASMMAAIILNKLEK
jgi:hypothetical protein